MPTEKTHVDRSDAMPLARSGDFRFHPFRLLLALTAGIALCHVALAQPDAEDPAADGAVEQSPDAAPETNQKYQQLPADEGLKRNYPAINQMLMAGRFSAGQQAEFDEYYQNYFLARWTDPKNITNLPAFRKELRNSHLGKRSAGAQVHDHLNSLMLDFMKNLIAGPYHPAVQINAMLMIGELNGVEQPPSPLPEALTLLSAAADNAEVSDALRAAAIIGIQRHAASGISDQNVRRTLTGALLQIASADLPAGIARPGREWILGQTIETLGDLGTVGDANAVFKVMLKNVTDDKLSLSTRGIAAQSLGRLNYAGATGINAAQAAADLGQFLIDVCAEELRKSQASGDPISRRRLQQYLIAVQTALDGDVEGNRKGIAPLASAQNQQAVVDGLKKLVDTMVDEVGQAGEGDDLTDSVDKLQSDLEAWLKKG